MSNKYKDFGEMLRELRNKKGESITLAAKSIGIDRTHLSKLENGHERPSSTVVLNSIVRHYSLSRAEALRLSGYAGYAGIGLIVDEQGRKEDVNMENKIIPPTGQDQGVQVNMNQNVPILYTDSVFVISNQYGIVFDFAQSMGPTPQQNIVSRIGMSKEHAKALLKVLEQRLSDKSSEKN